MDEKEFERRLRFMGQYKDSLDELTLWRYRVASTLLIASSAIFSVLLTLGWKPMGIVLCPCYKILHDMFYSLLLAINAVNILFLLATLYENIELSKRISRILRDAIQTGNYIQVRHDGTALDYVGGNRHKFYVFCEKASYVSFVIFVIFLLLYSFFNIFIFNV